MNLLCKGIQIYRLLQDDPFFEDDRTLREFVTAHILQENFVWAERDGDIVGASVIRQIRDPNDVLEFDGSTDADTTGKYVHIQHIYIHTDYRNGSILKELFDTAFKRFKGASRISFQRLPERVRPKKRRRGRPVGLRSRNSRRIHVLMFGGHKNGNSERTN